MVIFPILILKFPLAMKSNQMILLLAVWVALSGCAGSRSGGEIAAMEASEIVAPSPQGYSIPVVSEATADTIFGGVDEQSKLYLGTWAGEAWVEFDYEGVSILEDNYSLIATFSEGNHAVGITDAMKDVGPWERILLWGYIGRLKNIDYSQTDLESGQIASTGVIWEEADEVGQYKVTLDVMDDPEVYDVRFEGSDSLIFMWEDSEGEHEVKMLRQ